MAASISECTAIQETATIISNEPLTSAIFKVEVECPSIASQIRPGQFLMIRPEFGYDPLLGRPLAVYDVQTDKSGEAQTLSLVYQVFGRGTAKLSQMSTGDRVRIWGPLGHSFEANPGVDRIWFVAGGIGYTPFLALGKWWLGEQTYGKVRNSLKDDCQIKFLYGARSASLLPPLREFSEAGMTTHLCTEDGTAGQIGRVTDLMSIQEGVSGETLPDLVVACGPEPMLAAVSKWAAERAVRCLVSLENQMACGFGACFSCVAPIRQADESVDLRRVCLEGPIFDAQKVAWHEGGRSGV